jgi:NAD(P)-dependent dehydrogenase (short-subunit alcohol dehydrogenase family)
MEIQDKVVVITGGASGLGRATADYFRARGARVAIFDLNEEMGNAAVAELGEDNALFLATDVTSEESVTAAVEATMDRFGAIHININCAGVPAPCKVLDREGRATALKKFAHCCAFLVENGYMNGRTIRLDAATVMPAR